MDLEPTAEQGELTSSVHRWLQEHCPTSLVREVAEGRRPSDTLWSDMVALGWQGLTVPEERGGLGLGIVEVSLVAEELGRFVTPGPLLATMGLFAPALGASVTPEAGEVLEEVAAGTSTGTLVPPSGQFVIDGGSADWLVTLTDDEARLVPGSEAEVEPVTSLDPTRPLAHVEVAPAAGTSLGGLEVVRAALDAARVVLAAETVGACQAVFDRTVEHARVREQFDVPIGSFQAVKHQLADGFVALEKARSTVHVAALTIAEDDPRREVCVPMAKAAAGDCQRIVAAQAIQLHGGIGYTWEHDVHLYVKRAKANDLLFGTARDHRRTIAAEVLDQPATADLV